VSIDTDDGEVHASPLPDPLPFSSVEAMAWDPDTDMLVAVDRTTQTLFEVELATWTVRPLAAVGYGAIRGLAVVPTTDELLVVDTDLDQVLILDRYTGQSQTPFEPLKRSRGVGEATSVHLLWPRGDVLTAGCTTWAIEATADYEADGVLVFRCGEKELARVKFEPTRVLTIQPLPEAVRQALATEKTITWGLAFEKRDDVTTEFTLVERPKIHTGLASLAALETRSARIRKVREARLLSRHGLHSDAFQRLMGTAAEHETGIPWTRAMVTALRGLEETPERILTIIEKAATLRQPPAEKPEEK
jgi:hypothetical protein